MKKIIKFLAFAWFNRRIRNALFLSTEEQQQWYSLAFTASLNRQPKEPIVILWEKDCQERLDRDTLPITQEIETCDVEISRLIERKQIPSRDLDIKEQKEEAQVKAKIELTNRKNELERALDENKKQQDDLKTQQAMFKRSRKNIPTRKSLFDTMIGVLVIIGGVSGLEFMINYPGFVNLGVPDFFILPISGAISFSIAICVHFTGKMHAEQQRNHQLLWFIIGCALLATLVYVRWGSDHNMLFSILGFLTYLIATLLANYRAERQMHWFREEAIKRLGKERKALMKELDSVESSLDNFDEAAHAQTKRLSNEDTTNITNEIMKQENKKEALQKQKEAVIQQNGKRKSEGVAIINEGYAAGTRQRTSQRNGRMPPGTIAIIAVIFGLLSSCSHPDPVIHESMYTNDKTGSVVVEDQSGLESTYNGLVSMLPFDKDIYAGSIVRIVTLGPSSIPDIITLELKPVTGLLERVEKTRLAQIEAYKQQIKETLTRVMNSPSLGGPSNLSRNLCYLLNMLERSKATERTLLFASDGLENNLMPFDDEATFKKQTHEEIADAFESDCGIGDLNGISITFIHRSNSANDEITRKAQEFWAYYLEDRHGADFKVVSNPEMAHKY